jgi:hypothetical protein
MADEIAWAARYQFLEELWRGQDRIIFDPALEELLRVGGGGVGHGSHAALAELTDGLIPRDVGDEDVWVVLGNPRRGGEYSRLRAGTTFVGLDEGASLVSDEDWQVAIVDLGGMLAEPAAGRSVPDEDLAIEARLDPRLSAFVEVLAEAAAEGKTVVFSVAAEDAGGLGYDAFVDLLVGIVPDAMLFGLGDATAALVFDFGGVSEDEDAADDDEDDDEDEEGAEYDAALDEAEDEWTSEVVEDEADSLEDGEDVPIDYDNTLGDPEPTIHTWIAISSPRVVSGGMTVIELPRAQRGGPQPEASGMRAQLTEVQHQADLAAIERQRVMEQLEEAEDRIAELSDERERLLDGAAEVSVLGDGGGRLDEVLAREQAARWELNQVRAQLEHERARPVDELEAEVARLEVALENRPVPARAAQPSSAAAVVVETTGPAPATESAPGLRNGEGARLRGEVDRLLRRIERGGMPTLELHRELKRLRRFLSR